MKLRLARTSEMDAIFLMAYDTWHENQSMDAYLRTTHASTEFKEGEWYVLEEPATHQLLSSLILYDFNTTYEKIYGIGSVATPPSLRNKGYASELIKQTITLVMKEKKGTYIILYSDIDPIFYEKLGFIKAPQDMQNNSNKICMIYPTVPPYF